MKGCVLYGRYVFANDEKNERLRQKQSFNEALIKNPDKVKG